MLLQSPGRRNFTMQLRQWWIFVLALQSLSRRLQQKEHRQFSALRNWIVDTRILKKDTHIVFAEQKERLGTAHAVAVGFQKIADDVTDVLVIQGDDSAFYTKEVIASLAAKHVETNAAITFLTVKLDNPFALGRVV